MKADDTSPSEEFLFGRLSTPAGRMEEARQERRGFFDLSMMEPLDPRPGEPIRLCFRCGLDVSLQRLRVFWTLDGVPPTWNERLEAQNSTRTVDAQRLAPVWDTLSWGYVQDWEAELPALPEGRLLRYAGVGIDPTDRAIPCPWPDRNRHAAPHLAAVTVDRPAPPDWLRRAGWDGPHGETGGRTRPVEKRYYFINTLRE